MSWELAVNGIAYGGWKSIRVARSLEQFADAFELSFTERWTGQDEPIAIQAGDAAVVRFAGQPVITGYVDDDQIAYSATDHTMSVSGRSKTGDLCDCAAIYKTGTWKNKGLDVIARNLCQPFGISLDSESADVGGPFPWFSIHRGETVFEVLSRGAAMRGLMARTTTAGDVLFSDGAGTKISASISPELVVEGTRTGSWRDRFSAYTVSSQVAGSDDWSGAKCTAKAEAEDSGVTRYRPTFAEVDGATKAYLKKRAEWERSARAGRSQRLKYTVNGWDHKDGLWAPGQLVKVADRYMHVDAELMVVSTVHIRDDQGSRTEIELASPTAFASEPPRERDARGSWVS